MSYKLSITPIASAGNTEVTSDIWMTIDTGSSVSILQRSHIDQIHNIVWHHPTSKLVTFTQQSIATVRYDFA